VVVEQLAKAWCHLYENPAAFLPVCSLKIDFCAQTLLRRASARPAREPKEGSELTETTILGNWIVSELQELQ